VVVAVAFAKFVAPDNPTPDQEYVTPDTGPPTNVVEVFAQVNVPPIADADGEVVFWDTATLPVV
jgi:hypothetical protein